MIRPIFLSICLLAAGGCNSMIANNFVRAPNRNSSTRGQDAPNDVLAEHHVTQQLRIDVGPPTASLSVWVIDPIAGPGCITLDPGGDYGQPAVHLHLKSSPAAVAQANKPPKATLFLLAGLGDGKDEGPYQLYSLALACQGYRVVLVDQRGEGRSTGDRIAYGAYESHDMVQVLDALKDRGLVSGEVGVIGISYGASVAICWSAIDPRVRSVVAIEPFCSLRDAICDAGPMMLEGMGWMYSKNDYVNIMQRIGRIDGFDPDRDSPLFAIAHSTTPVLLIHGKDDDFVRPVHSQHLHEAAPDHSKLILVDNANHFDLWFKGVETIMSETDQWFGRYLTPPPSAAMGQ